ncbi:MAG TPA: HEAT repeat domain-containing protein, partial [Armatimonadota bacterium]|nr:HEAT repeat domain-containing protein [Armatimonadota bacterium]
MGEHREWLSGPAAPSLKEGYLFLVLGAVFLFVVLLIVVTEGRGLLQDWESAVLDASLGAVGALLAAGGFGYVGRKEWGRRLVDGAFWLLIILLSWTIGGTAAAMSDPPAGAIVLVPPTFVYAFHGCMLGGAVVARLGLWRPAILLAFGLSSAVRPRLRLFLILRMAAAIVLMVPAGALLTVAQAKLEVKHFHAQLQSPNPEQRATAILELAEWRPRTQPEVAPAVRALESDPSAKVREGAASALMHASASLRAWDAYAALLKAMKGDPSAKVRAQAASSLGWALHSSHPLPEKWAWEIYVSLLKAMTEDTAPEVRRDASTVMRRAAYSFQRQRSRAFVDRVRGVSRP